MRNVILFLVIIGYSTNLWAQKLEEELEKKVTTTKTSVMQVLPLITVLQKVQKVLGAKQPDIQLRALDKPLIAGFYTLQIQGGPKLYTSADGNHFFIGDLYSIANDVLISISDQDLIEERRKYVRSLKESDYIAFKAKGKSKGVLNVFTDVSCGYCRKFHAEMETINALGIEVRYLPFPRAGVGSAIYQQMVSAWCAPNPQKSITVLKKGGSIASNLCKGNPVATHYEKGQMLGVTGTPSIILNNGVMIPGYRPPHELLKLFFMDKG